MELLEVPLVPLLAVSVLARELVQLLGHLVHQLLELRIAQRSILSLSEDALVESAKLADDRLLVLALLDDIIDPRTDLLNLSCLLAQRLQLFFAESAGICLPSSRRSIFGKSLVEKGLLLRQLLLEIVQLSFDLLLLFDCGVVVNRLALVEVCLHLLLCALVLELRLLLEVAVVEEGGLAVLDRSYVLKGKLPL